MTNALPGSTEPGSAAVWEVDRYLSSLEHYSLGSSASSSGIRLVSAGYVQERRGEPCEGRWLDISGGGGKKSDPDGLHVMKQAIWEKRPQKPNQIRLLAP